MEPEKKCKDITSLHPNQCTGITKVNNTNNPTHAELSQTVPVGTCTGITPLLTSTSFEVINIPTTHDNAQSSTSLINNTVGPLIQEMRVLEESAHNDYTKLEGIIITQQSTIAKIETSISTQQREMSSVITEKIEKTTMQVAECLEETHLLWRENTELKERLNKIELTQLGNNVIISGMQEQPWEGYSMTKERVNETSISHGWRESRRNHE